MYILFITTEKINNTVLATYFSKDQATGKMFVKYEVIGSNHVAVPTHFFKVVVGEKQDGALEMECYVMENTVIDDSIELKNFQVCKVS